MRILVVEDDSLLGDGIRAGLIQEGYTVEWVQDGDAAEAALSSEAYDLLILDLGLPKRPGLHILKQLRSRGSQMPVLILTARDTLNDRIAGLDAGADDYMNKPFDLEELFARIRALNRRCNPPREEGLIRHGDLVLNLQAHTLTREGRTIDLPPREFSLLRHLLENRGRVLSRSQLEEAVYSWDAEIESNAIEVHVHHLRRKLGNQLIRTVRGVGYVVEKEP